MNIGRQWTDRLRLWAEQFEKHYYTPCGALDVRCFTTMEQLAFDEASNYEASMEVGPAFGVHHFTAGKEDSEVKTPGAATVYMTDYTAFHHVISIRH